MRHFIPILLLFIFSALGFLLIQSPPDTPRKLPNIRLPVVEVNPHSPSSHPISLAVSGKIIAPQKEIELSSENAGKIGKLHPHLIVGGTIPAGETIAQLEEADFLLELKSAQANLTKTNAALSVAQGNHRLAKKELALSGYLFSDDDQNKKLALRLPDLHEAEADVDIAHYKLAQAKLTLNRATINYPYDVKVTEVSTALGEYISEGKTIAKVVRTDEVWIELNIPQQYLTKINVKTEKNQGSIVTFSFNQHTFTAEVFGIHPKLRENSRLVKVIARVTPSGKPVFPFVINSHIEATVEFEVLKDVQRLSRQALPDPSHVYVVDQAGRLQVRPAGVKWQTEESVYISPEIQAGDRLVSRPVYGIFVGSKVRAVSVLNHDHILNQTMQTSSY
ncbi:efflux RND transporter periplasmic adaptor subunit [Lacimicrobium sp. SS2-24]|uniref:efflux RND transporter periplasmic adaptor subunit n=1 Tax=Lacimicrobium sp. SS2-24 TaxID=2005569 RepID=UPI00143A7515|nr:efflux RND transporter periplasmic adaptor subunit [Lacimicrobium sp. SS2-24]